MATAARTASGLRLWERFNSGATGWTGGTGWSIGALPAPLTWGRIREVLAPGGEGEADHDGVREPTPIAVPAERRIYNFVDGGNGTTGWRPQVAISLDRSISVASREVLSSGVSDGSSGSHAAVAVGCVALWEGAWVHHRITCSAVYSAPLAGLPAGGYGYDVWNGTLYNGDWAYGRTIPLGSGGAWNDTEFLPGSMMWDEGDELFYHYTQGRQSGGNYKIGYGTSTTPGGAITVNATPIIDSTQFFGDVPENPRTILYAALAAYCCFTNLINGIVGTYTGRNAATVSATKTFASKQSYITQSRLAACDDVNAEVVGVASPIMGPNLRTFEEWGFLPGYFDCYPRDGNHIGRRCFGMVWEASTHALVFNDSSGTRRRFPCEDFEHGAFVAEFAVLFPDGPVSGSDVAFEFWGLRLRVRNDGNQTLRLEYLDGTEIANGGSGTVIDAGVSNRVRVVAKLDGTVTAYINKELQISASGLTPGGDEIAFSGKSCHAQIREFRFYDSETLKLTGLSPGQQVWLRTHGGYAALPVVQTDPADENGEVEVDIDHYPISRIEVAPGVDVQVNGGATEEDCALWGGDVVHLTFPSARGGMTLGGMPVLMGTAQ